MGFKEKVLGIVLILAGVLPFLLKIHAVSNFFTSNVVLNFIVPGEIVYQILIIILGILVLWTAKSSY